MLRIFKTDLIREQMSNEHLAQLAADFKRYKETGTPADYFGRDAPRGFETNIEWLQSGNKPRQMRKLCLF